MAPNWALNQLLAAPAGSEASLGSPRWVEMFSLNGSLMLLAGVPISVQMLGQWVHFDNLGSLAQKLLKMVPKSLTFDSLGSLAQKLGTKASILADSNLRVTRLAL